MIDRSWFIGRALTRDGNIRLATLIAIGLFTAAAPATTQSQPGEQHDEPSASLGGRVVDAEGRAVAGARVWLRHGKPANERFEQTVSDGNGRYRFERVEPGSATLAVLAAGHAWDGVQH